MKPCLTRFLHYDDKVWVLNYERNLYEDMYVSYEIDENDLKVKYQYYYCCKRIFSDKGFT